MNQQITRVEIFDTTLRDGQQCPGAGMSFAQNLEYARLAAKVGVDTLEAGFPAASDLDFAIVRSIVELYASMPEAPTVAALCQLREEQIDRTIEALSGTPADRKARLHVYVPVAPALMAASLGEKADKEAILRDTARFIERAVAAGLEVEFSPEGYSRMGDNFSFVTELLSAAVGAGARVLNCPDTIGGASALEGEAYYLHAMNRHAAELARRFPAREILWSVHCHNDFGLAVQNSIEGVVVGPARQIEGCFNGVGERAGNAALEQVALIIDAFGQGLAEPLCTGLRLEHLGEICAFVAEHMLPQQPHSPVSGANAARHSSGGHTNAVLRNPLVYQPFDPRRLGVEISLAFGPLSGGNHAKSIIEKAGYICGDDEKAAIAQHIKNFYSERRKGITDEELLLAYFDYRAPICIEEFDYSRSKDRSQIDLRGRFFDSDAGIHDSHQGKDSALAALKQAIDRHFACDIESHQSRSEGSGIGAVSVSTIVLRDSSGAVHTGIGRDQDIEISAMKALIDAVNQAFIDARFRLGSLSEVRKVVGA